MIRYSIGNLFNADAHVLVNPVNCVGVMGKGLALQFKKSFPQNFHNYKILCENNRVTPGRVDFTEENGKIIINFPTKRHWRDKSNILDISAGLDSFVDIIMKLRRQGKFIGNPKAIAMPALGCGLGGLNWATVRVLMEDKLTKIPDDIDTIIFLPKEEYNK